MLVVFRSATNMVVNERAFIENVPGTRSLTPTSIEDVAKVRIDNSYVPPNLMVKAALPSGAETQDDVDARAGGKAILNIVVGCAGVASVLGMASFVVMKKRALQGQACKGKEFKSIDATCVSHVKDSRQLCAMGMRVRRSRSQEELTVDKDMEALKRSSSADAVYRIALADNSTEAGSMDSFDSSLQSLSSFSSSLHSLYSSNSSVSSSWRRKKANSCKDAPLRERTALRTVETFGPSTTPGPGSTSDAACSDVNLDILVKLDLVDWHVFNQQQQGWLSKSAGGVHQSCSTSPYVSERGSLSLAHGHDGEHFSANSYRPDLALCELCRDKLIPSFKSLEDDHRMNSGHASRTAAGRSDDASEKKLRCLRANDGGIKAFRKAGSGDCRRYGIESRLFR